MKACIRDKAPDICEEKSEKLALRRESGVGLRRRALRVLKTKIYFLFHDRESGVLRNLPHHWIKAVPVEGLILLAFIISMFLLSILLTCQSLSGHFGFYGLFAGMMGFMATAIPVISVVASASLGLMALNYLAKYYIERCGLLQK